MHYADVPPSTPLVAASSRGPLESALNNFLMSDKARVEGRIFHFGSYEIIEGAPWSGRIIFVGPSERGAKLPPMTGSEKLADNICDLGCEARYPRTNTLDAQKGWELRKTMVAGQDAIILYPAWIDSDPNIEN